jgi:hypothetical protein
MAKDKSTRRVAVKTAKSEHIVEWWPSTSEAHTLMHTNVGSHLASSIDIPQRSNSYPSSPIECLNIYVNVVCSPYVTFIKPWIWSSPPKRICFISLQLIWTFRRLFCQISSMQASTGIENNVCSAALTENPLFAQLLWNSSPFVQPKGPLQCSQELASDCLLWAK